METRNARHGARSTGIKKLVLVLTLLAVLAIPSGAMAAQPVHSVRGHGIYRLIPPTAIDQISINASADENGVVTGGMAVWPSIYLAPPDQPPPLYAGWTWRIEISSLTVTGNVATLSGNIVADNRFPDNVGCPVGFIVTDNGSGASNPPDVLELLSGPCVGGGQAPILGGNFTVR